MRPASELANQICGCATREQHNRDVALIEADRAALVSEICDYFRMHRECPFYGDNVADAIQAKWGSHD